MNSSRSECYVVVASTLRPRRKNLVLGGVLAVFAAICIFASQPGFSPGWRTLSNGPGSTVDVLESADPGWPIERVVEDGGWKPLGNPGDFLRENPESVLWVRARIANPGPGDLRGVIADSELYSDRVDFYETIGGGRWRHLRAGEAVAAAEKPLAGREAAFPLTVPAGESREVYLRFEDRFSMPARVVWWPREAEMLQARSRATFAEGLYFGVLAMLFFSNAAVWLRLRFPDVRRYLLYLGALAVFMFVSRNELPMLGWPIGSPALEAITLLSLGLSLVFLMDFAREFLALPQVAPRWDRLVVWLRAMALAFAVGGLVMPWIPTRSLLDLAVLFGIVIQALLLAGAVGAWRAGVDQARFFVAAFGAFLLGLLPSLRILFLPSPGEITELAGFTMLAGSGLELLLFSAATADRFARLEQEKSEAREALLRESERREILQEAYADELAHEVRERTRELEAIASDQDRVLAVLGHDLRGPLAGLTGLAEQTAGRKSPAENFTFAESAARVGRQMLYLIEDLVLWLRMRSGPGQIANHPVDQLIVPTLDLLRADAEIRGLMLRRGHLEPASVTTDFVQAQTLLRNLLANACRFARTEVVVNAQKIRDHVQIRIRDDGPGMPAEIAEWLSSEDPEAPSPSERFGLRLCRDIAREHRMRLEVLPGKEQGTEILVSIPAAVLRAASCTNPA